MGEITLFDESIATAVCANISYQSRNPTDTISMERISLDLLRNLFISSPPRVLQYELYLEILVELLPKVVVDRGDDEVDLEELGGQADHQEEGEEGDQEHLIFKDEMGRGEDVNQSSKDYFICVFCQRAGGGGIVASKNVLHPRHRQLCQKI